MRVFELIDFITKTAPGTVFLFQNLNGERIEEPDGLRYIHSVHWERSTIIGKYKLLPLVKVIVIE